MANIVRRGNLCKIPATVVACAANDLDGTGGSSVGTGGTDVTGTLRVLIVQINNGTDGTAGIDVVETSTDGGTTWAADTLIMLASANDVTGAVVASGALNAAGVEPTGAQVWKTGPFEGPTKLRIGRKTTTTGGTTWVTGSPEVRLVLIGA